MRDQTQHFKVWKGDIMPKPTQRPSHLKLWSPQTYVISVTASVWSWSCCDKG